ncbi:hypothetical protein ACOTJC_29000 [Achromobacter xylosoxidans]|uniref:hypothetical protein n=1 Tax=Alcaligenes xylosoxydans xylosoxydans TaxID=85698 RepID=UPI002E189B84|nr:hypothetical protein [Achromobacter xylosoxidans]
MSHYDQRFAVYANEGFAAYHNGVRENPYTDQVAAFYWTEGWNDAYMNDRG